MPSRIRLIHKTILVCPNPILWRSITWTGQNWTRHRTCTWCGCCPWSEWLGCGKLHPGLSVCSTRRTTCQHKPCQHTTRRTLDLNTLKHAHHPSRFIAHMASGPHVVYSEESRKTFQYFPTLRTHEHHTLFPSIPNLSPNTASGIVSDGPLLYRCPASLMHHFIAISDYLCRRHEYAHHQAAVRCLHGRRFGHG